jgi:hypothetical protein
MAFCILKEDITMSSQKIPGVGRLEVSFITDYTSTKTGVLCRDADNNIRCHIPCDIKHHDRLIEALYAAKSRNAAQIDFSFLND